MLLVVVRRGLVVEQQQEEELSRGVGVTGSWGRAEMEIFGGILGVLILGKLERKIIKKNRWGRMCIEMNRQGKFSLD